MEKTLQKTQVSTGQVTLEAAGEGAAQAGMGIITILSALIGLWGTACLVGGIMAAGGPIELARAWVGAVAGM